MFLTSIDNYSFRYQFLFLPSTCEWDRELSWFNRPQYSFWDSLASGLPNAFGKWGILPFISNKEVKSAHLSDPEKVLLQTTLCGILPFSLHFLSVWITLEFYLTKKKKKETQTYILELIPSAYYLAEISQSFWSEDNTPSSFLWCYKNIIFLHITL